MSDPDRYWHTGFCQLAGSRIDRQAPSAARSPGMVRAVLFGLILGCLTLRAAETEMPLGPIIELPIFEVTDSRLLPPPESWHYAEIPGFEILSNISQRETKRFVSDFLLLQEVIKVIMPGLIRPDVPVPTALILCGRGKGLEQFLPADRADDSYRTNSLFLQNPERAAIVVDFALSELQLDNDRTEDSDPYRGFYLEYFRFLLRRHVTNSPAWFEEGLVQLFAATDFNRKWINFAQIGDGFGGEKTGDFNHRLSRRALIPLGRFFTQERPKTASAFWSAQCYAFVHMCLYGLNQKYQKPLLKFLDRLGREEVTEAMFKECFGKTYSQMGIELRGYLDFTMHKSFRYTAKKGQELPESPPVALRDAPDAIVGRIKGEALRLGGHGAEAHNALVAPYVRGERDPRLLAALGLDERLAGNDERARKFLEAAAAAKVDRALAYLELARLRYAAALAKPGARDGLLDVAQVSSVLEPLFVARGQPPPMAAVYVLMAETWARSVVPPKLEHLDAVIEGVRMFPRDLDLLMQAVQLSVAHGFPAVARQLAARGVKIAANEAERDRFQVLASTGQRDSPEAPAVISPAQP